jgi:DNA-binding GntR family transcriptional regulator
MDKLAISGVTKSVVQHLRMHIIEGTLAPGQKLNELELSTRLGISRPPLREAFRILENENLIISIPRKGCYVSQLSVNDCRQIYKARELVECGSLDCFKKQDIRDLPAVEKALNFAQQQQAIPSDDNKIAELGSRNPFPYFHIKLVESTGNNWLIRFYHMIAPTLARYQFICYVPEILSRIQEEHKVLLDLIRNGEYDSAKQLLKRHIDWYVKFIEQTLRENEGKREAEHVGM